MFSLFWRFFCYLWLTIILVMVLTFGLTKIVNQDVLIKTWHPAFHNLEQDFFAVYKDDNKKKLQAFLKEKYKKHNVYIQVLNEQGNELISYKSHHHEKHHKADRHSNWRRFNQEFKYNGEDYLFIYRIAQQEINKWQRQNYIWLILIAIASLVILTLASFLLTFSITNPLNKLRLAVKDLEQNNYKQHNLAKLLVRRDEIGILAQDFNNMGVRIQQLITNQRQLLRDVSHELRSPLARLKIITSLLAQTNMADKNELEKLQNKANLECTRLDKLIDEILTLSRLDESKQTEFKEINLFDELNILINDLLLINFEQKITLNCPNDLKINTNNDLLMCALGNLIRNALKFNDDNLPIIINVTTNFDAVKIAIRDFGIGVNPQFLDKLGEPFFRTGEKNVTGNGLGLAITKRACANLGAKLHLANAEPKGFIATITILI